MDRSVPCPVTTQEFNYLRSCSPLDFGYGQQLPAFRERKGYNESSPNSAVMAGDLSRAHGSVTAIKNKVERGLKPTEFGGKVLHIGSLGVKFSSNQRS